MIVDSFWLLVQRVCFRVRPAHSESGRCDL